MLKAAKVILKFIWKNKEVRKSETMEEQVAGEAGADMGVTGEKQHGTHTRRPHSECKRTLRLHHWCWL